jgi:hypothetical protein
MSLSHIVVHGVGVCVVYASYAIEGPFRFSRRGLCRGVARLQCKRNYLRIFYVVCRNVANKGMLGTWNR